MAEHSAQLGGRAGERVSLARLVREGAMVVGAALLVILLSRLLTGYLLLTVFTPNQQRYSDAASADALSHTGMLDQETGLRAFIISKDRTFLEPYSQGVKEMADGNLQLASLVGSDPALATDLQVMEAAQQRWVDGWALPALSAADITTGGNQSDFLVRDKLLFDDYRTDAAKLNADIASRGAAGRRNETWVLLLVSGLDIAAAVGAVVFSGIRLRRLAAELRDPVGRLDTHLESLIAGAYDSRVQDGGRVLELASVSARADQLAERLGARNIVATARDAEMAEQAARLRLLLELTRDIAGSLSLRYILRSVADSAVRLSPFDVVSVWQVDDSRRGLVPAFLSSGPDGQPMGLEPLELGSSLPGLAAKYGQAFRHDTASDAPSGYQPERTMRAIAVPMIVGARCVGVIELATTSPTLDAEVDLPVIETLAIHAGAAIEAARLHRTAEDQAQVDGLTRLFNRRRLDEDLGQEVSRALRYGRPLAFVMLDTDHFKKLNDDLGHQKGDEVLQELSDILREGLRVSDTAYRYGGEEFALILRETSLAEGTGAAERIRLRVEQRFGGPGNAAKTTASFGVAALGPTVQNPEQLIRAADHALYEAKQAGRNRVVAPDSVPAKPVVHPAI